jgi:hypothetical protein
MRDAYLDDLDDDVVIPDGGVVRVRVDMMDHHQPGYRSVSDATVRDARAAATASYRAMCARLQHSWRSPPNASRDAPQPDNSSPAAVMRRHLRTDSDHENQAHRDRAWADYRDRLSNAWRTDPRAGTAIERQGEAWRGGR